MQTLEVEPKYYSIRAILIIVIGLITVSCGQENPRDAFRTKLNNNVDKLTTKISFLGTGAEETVEVTTSTAGRSRDTTLRVPKSAGIENVAKDIGKMFFSLEYALLNEDLEGFQEWGKLLEADIESYRTKINEAVKNVSVRIKTSSAKQDGNFITRLVNMAGQVEFDENGELYIVVGSGRTKEHYFPKRTLQIDVDEWLQGLKIKSQNFQVTADDESPLHIDQRILAFLIKRAELGETNAQYGLALKYYDGDGVEGDIVRANMWALIAQKNGHSNAGQTYYFTQGLMTNEQIDQADRLAINWLTKYKKNTDTE